MNELILFPYCPKRMSWLCFKCNSVTAVTPGDKTRICGNPNCGAKKKALPRRDPSPGDKDGNPKVRFWNCPDCGKQVASVRHQCSCGYNTLHKVMKTSPMHRAIMAPISGVALREVLAQERAALDVRPPEQVLRESLHEHTYFLAIYIDIHADSVVVGTYLAPWDREIQYKTKGNFCIQRDRWTVAGPGIMNVAGLETYLRDLLTRYGDTLVVLATQPLFVRPFLCFGRATPLRMFDPNELMRPFGPDAEASFRREAEQDGVTFSLETPENRAEEMYFRAVWALLWLST